MKVTGVTHFLVSSGQAKNFIFVRVDTDEGISGWGEAYTQTDRGTSHSVLRRSDEPIPRRPQSIQRQALHPRHVQRLSCQARLDGSLLRAQRHRARPLGYRRQEARRAGL